MDASTAHKHLITRADRVFEEAAATRANLTDALAIQGAQFDHLMDAVLVAEGKAKPWMHLMKRIDRHGVREGLAKQREECMEALLMYGFSMSTSLVTNAARFAEQDGLRRFLDATDTMEIEGAPAEETPAPTVVTVPQVTAEQKHGLYLIRDTFVKRQGFTAREGWKYVTSVDDARLDTKLGDFLIGHGWAEVDTEATLTEGQPVTLTATGRHILAA
ncbi:hypothetical protein [Streptomyces sp. NBC_01763]|uniref:hypothetical protein n=1 Tax=Streptomyces sp. NBC_01763 TaxID=2975934 RepID=UPI002DD80749|nr:hypothetical protein [Streptomyces sp. NBC_01763]WSC35630.1 DUF1664 domain-containing protein [Streptomyces sp. NBC_01763]